MGGKALTRADCDIIQKDLDQVVQWSEKWQMPFHLSKCKAMHIGARNSNHVYNMSGNLLHILEKSDIGVAVSSDLNHSKHCKLACRKANTMLGFIARNFDYKTPEVVLKLYTSMVLPHLEYSVQFWFPSDKKDIAPLERVERRATKMIPSLRGQSYEERLKRLNLFTLGKRRIGGDLIQVLPKQVH